MPWFDLIDAACKLAGAFASIATLGLIWRRALPRIDQIHTETIQQTTKIEKIEDQTNGFAQKIEAAAHVAGVVVGTSIATTATASLKEEADKMADVLKAATMEARETLSRKE